MADEAPSETPADERPASPLWSERALLTMGVVLLAFLLLETADGLAGLVAGVIVLAVMLRPLLVGAADGD